MIRAGGQNYSVEVRALALIAHQYHRRHGRLGITRVAGCGWG